MLWLNITVITIISKNHNNHNRLGSRFWCYCDLGSFRSQIALAFTACDLWRQPERALFESCSNLAVVFIPFIEFVFRKNMKFEVQTRCLLLLLLSVLLLLLFRDT